MMKLLLLTLFVAVSCQTTNHHRDDLVADELVSYGAETQVQRLHLQTQEIRYITLSEKPLHYGNIYLRTKGKTGNNILVKMPEHPIKFYNMAMKHHLFANNNPQALAVKLMYDFIPLQKTALNLSKQNLRKSSGNSAKVNQILEKEYKWILNSAIKKDLKNIHLLLKKGKDQTPRFILLHQKIAAALSRVRLLYEMNSNYYKRMAMEINENKSRVRTY